MNPSTTLELTKMPFHPNSVGQRGVDDSLELFRTQWEEMYQRRDTVRDNHLLAVKVKQEELPPSDDTTTYFVNGEPTGVHTMSWRKKTILDQMTYFLSNKCHHTLTYVVITDGFFSGCRFITEFYIPRTTDYTMLNQSIKRRLNDRGFDYNHTTFNTMDAYDRKKELTP